MANNRLHRDSGQRAALTREPALEKVQSNNHEKDEVAL